MSHGCQHHCNMFSACAEKNDVTQVLSLSQKTVTRNPQPPFITSTLHQDASVKLGYNPSTSMQLAQQLYEGPEASGGASASYLQPHIRLTDSHAAAMITWIVCESR